MDEALSRVVIASMRPTGQGFARMSHDHACRFERIALRPVFGEEGKADVRIWKRIALKQAAHAERHAVGLAFDAHEAVSVARVAGDGSVGNVLARVVEGPHAAVADVAQERGLVDEPEDEFAIVSGELAERQPRGLEHGHWCSAQNGSTVRSTKETFR
jgi:hypothetical protein